VCVIPPDAHTSDLGRTELGAKDARSETAANDKGAGEKSASDKGVGEKSAADKGAGDKGAAADKGSADKKGP